jgi:uncharacterized phage protein (TIGR01671 family)
MKQRPIKFRFWCNAGKSFIQQYRYSGYVDELFDEKEWDILTPSQYTGCNDCEEKEIWEGDIVEYEVTIAGSQTKKILGVVEYVDGAFFVKTINHEGTWSFLWLHDSYSYNHKLNVVGNKFENPELMK